MKRVGWTKPNAFHVCITSYKLVIQDQSSFRRKQWYYFILDEAQHIKNFKSQRWQLLLNFSSRGRLLLTGTPLQNNLMELWSLMHFLMPDVFQSHANFKEWFSNPLTGMVEDSQEYNESLVKRLHKVLRPFLLRRLKNEVEKQLPKKYEHTVYCSLSKRQRFLYDDFMSRAKTRETLEGGNFMSVINVLMQLRKVCNHPNLFEGRPTVSPLVCAPLTVTSTPSMLARALRFDPLREVDYRSGPLCLSAHEATLSAFTAFTLGCLKVTPEKVRSRKFGEPPPCPERLFRMSATVPSPAPAPLPGANQEYIPFTTIVNNNIHIKHKRDLNFKLHKGTFLLTPWAHTPVPYKEVVEWDLDPSERWDQIVDVEMETDDEEDEDLEEGEEPRMPRKGIFSSKIFEHAVPDDDDFGEKTTSESEAKFDNFVRYNMLRTGACPLYGCDLRESVTLPRRRVRFGGLSKDAGGGFSPFRSEWTPYR